MDNIKQKKVELLAPAGGKEQLRAAVENGADAVYLGGKKFNARMNASNFSIEEIKEAVIYAHTKDVRVFAALNILLTDDELLSAVQYAAELYAAGVDAVIVQDWGLAALIRKYIPNLEMHLSTQGCVYNRSGVKNALKLGFKRIVLAREMTIEEIKETTDLCDIEVFVHGAMCMCYSGQCQMSRAIGGRSGNRGECAQPCRLPYTDDKGRKGYFLSPKDMCAIDKIGDLIEAGVTSLKIEGRMKSPEYVATIVRIYRKYIDMYYNQGSYTVEEADRKELLQIFNRGGFSEGYLNGVSQRGMLSGDTPKHMGVYMGKVLKRIDKNLIEVKLDFRPEMGDGVEIRGKNITGNILTYIKKKKDDIYEIGDIKGEISKGEPVYRTSSKKQLESARASYKKMARKHSVGMSFFAEVGKQPELTVYDNDREVKVISSFTYEKAEKSPMGEELVKRQLKKTGESPFEAEYISVCVDNAGTMPLAEINKLRREALKAFEETFAVKREMPDIPKDLLQNLLKEYGQSLSVYKEQCKDIPVFGAVTKGKEDDYIKEHLDEKAVVINNIGWIDEFLQKGAKVYLGKGMNIMNKAAVRYFESLGAKVIEYSDESEKAPKTLMTTEHPLQSKKLIDRKGKTYTVEKSPFGDKWFLKG